MSSCRASACKTGRSAQKLAASLGLLTFTLACTAAAQATGPGLISTRSYSGQFVVQAPAMAGASLGGDLDADPALVRLDPTLMPVSCERLKQVLYRELGLPGGWAGKIFVFLYPARSAADTVVITSQHYTDGWRYRVDMPDHIQRTRYVRGLVQALLTELANRNARERSAEIPAWLVEGLTAEVLGSSELQIILPPPKANLTGTAPSFTSINTTRQQTPLEPVHMELTARTPLSFEQLSWPAPNQLTSESAELYRRSAQLFFNELLNLENGRARLQQMISELALYHNWQFALFHAYSGTFQSALDVEKWWAVHVLQFTGRDLAQHWSPAESWRKLDDCLRLRVQVHSASNALPSSLQTSLLTVIQTWNTADQDSVLPAMLNELQLIRMRAANESVDLIDAYIEALRNYLRDREHAGLPFGLRREAARRHLAQQTVKHLNVLESKRQQLQAAAPAAAGPAGASVAQGPVTP